MTARAPGLLALYGVGHDTAARLLIAAGDHPGRHRSEAAWAHLCATAPIPASPGKVTRHRHGPGGDRRANHALYRIVITRMSSHPATRAYVARRSKEGLTEDPAFMVYSGHPSCPDLPQRPDPPRKSPGPATIARPEQIARTL